MAIQSQPSRISEPFAGSGTKNVIPATNTTPSASQAASWASGFPPECSQPISAGGCPVPRNDMNGVLNWLSQGFAFGQDGGVWEWSALADYDVGRIVRGSDGILYESKAQSGPGLAAGAQDPTADDGTYWQAPTAKTMPPADSSGAVATTQWVWDAVENAPIYVDGTSGNDANDGLTQASAVKTIAQGLYLLSRRTGQYPVLNIVGGSFAEDINLIGTMVEFVLLDDISITGNLRIESNSALRVTGSYTLSVAGYIYTVTQSAIDIRSQIAITSSSRACIDVEDGSYASFTETVSLTANGTPYCITVFNGAGLYSSKMITAVATGVTTSILNIGRASNARLSNGISMTGASNGGGVQISSGSVLQSGNAILLAKNCTSSFGIRLAGSSTCRLDGGSSIIYGASNDDTTIVRLYSGSSLVVANLASLKICVEYTGSGGLWSLLSRDNASVFIDSGSSLLFEIASGASAKYHIVATLGGCVEIQSGGTLGFGSGNITSCAVSVSTNGVVDIHNNATVSGSVSGSRYNVDYGGMIYVHGSGANRIPGTSSGNASATSYGYYH